MFDMCSELFSTAGLANICYSARNYSVHKKIHVGFIRNNSKVIICNALFYITLFC